MQAGSTGLGKMALKMHLAEASEMTRLPPTKPPEGALVLYCKTTEPVVWNVWIAVEPDELPALLAKLLKPKLLWFVFKSLITAPFKSNRNMAARAIS
jgi:hypothetical protein